MFDAKMYSILVKLTDVKKYQTNYLVYGFTAISFLVSKLFEKLGFSTNFLCKY